MIIFAYSLTVLLLLLGLFIWQKERKQRLEKRVSNVLHRSGSLGGTDAEEEDIKKLPFSQRILVPLWKRLKYRFQKNLSNEKREKLENRLLQAGKPLGLGAIEFRFLQLSLHIALPIVFAGYSYLANAEPFKIIFNGMLGFILSVLLPSYYLKMKTTARHKKAVKELPDFLDLVTVSIEAGLGFDSALSKVVAKRDGVLSDEFQRCLEEMRLGRTRKEALSGVRERLAVEDVKTLIGSIIQAEQLGIGMVQILRIQSVEIRERRKQRAEEQAMKAPIKMLFPLVIFIFPCIFIVLLGPALIQILETL